jgi:hypothetical protein
MGKNKKDKTDVVSLDDKTDEVDFKILSKKVLKIQKKNIEITTNSFKSNDGIVGLSYF